MKIVVIGGNCADFLISVPRLPSLGETLKGNMKTAPKPGGKGANTAAGMGKLSISTDTKVYFIGKCG